MELFASIFHSFKADDIPVSNDEDYPHTVELYRPIIFMKNIHFPNIHNLGCQIQVIRILNTFAPRIKFTYTIITL